MSTAINFRVIQETLQISACGDCVRYRSSRPHNYTEEGRLTITCTKCGQVEVKKFCQFFTPIEQIPKPVLSVVQNINR